MKKNVKMQDICSKETKTTAASLLAVVCDVYDGVYFVRGFFPRDAFDEILNLIESVSEGFPTYS